MKFCIILGGPCNYLHTTYISLLHTLQRDMTKKEAYQYDTGVMFHNDNRKIG